MERAGRSWAALLPAMLVARVAINTPFRIVYPFLPSIARGLGISLAGASGLIALRLLAPLAAPLFGFWVDRWGRQQVMTAASLIFVFAGLLLAGLGTLAASAAAFVLYGVAKAMFDPAVLAYLGDRVPYAERGRAMGLIELAWSAAWLLSVPVSGVLIERFGWRAPWAALIGLGALGSWCVGARLPRADLPITGLRQTSLLAALGASWRRLFSQRSVVALLTVTVLFSLAMEMPLIVYGAWLEESFGLGLAVLGAASIAVGLAEAGAELSAAAFTDRLGKRRSVLVGLAGMAAGLMALPWLSAVGLPVALASFAFIVVTFEFGNVSLLPLVAELAPDARGTLLALNVAAFGLGRILGDLAGGFLWRWESIGLQAAAGAICAVAAMFVLARIVDVKDL